MLAITRAMQLNTRGQCGPLVHAQGSSTRTRKTSHFYSYLISTLKRVGSHENKDQFTTTVLSIFWGESNIACNIRLKAVSENSGYCKTPRDDSHLNYCTPNTFINAGFVYASLKTKLADSTEPDLLCRH